MRRAWILDLDNTLYPADSGLFDRVVERIYDYMVQTLDIPRHEAVALSSRYRETYGLTLGGLMAHHGVDPDEYMAYVHDLSLPHFIRPDPVLGGILADLSGEKVIFTNGSRAHARAVLSRLGIEDRIAGVFDIAFMDYVPKPRPHGYRKLLETLGTDPRECWMVDDLVENLNTARSLGMTTVLVGPAPAPPHLHVASARELAELTERTAANEQPDAPDP